MDKLRKKEYYQRKKGELWRLKMHYYHKWGMQIMSLKLQCIKEKKGFELFMHVHGMIFLQE